MRRLLWATLVLLATTGASPHPILPVPPIPPDNPPADQSAPVPDPNIRAPAATDQSGVQVNLQDFRVHRFDQSLGYAPGSHFETSEEKRPIQTPGLNLRVPLQ